MKSGKTELFFALGIFLVMPPDVFQLLGWLVPSFLAGQGMVVSLPCAGLSCGP